MRQIDRNNLERNSTLSLLKELKRLLTDLCESDCIAIVNALIAREYERETKARELFYSWQDEHRACIGIVRKRKAAKENYNYYNGEAVVLSRISTEFLNSHISSVEMQGQEEDEYNEDCCSAIDEITRRIEK